MVCLKAPEFSPNYVFVCIRDEAELINMETMLPDVLQSIHFYVSQIYF